MAIWIPCEDGFIEADVIRWKESAWERWGPRSARAVNIGDRWVTAEVLREEEGWVYLLVRGCKVVTEKTARKVKVLKKGSETKRKRKTIMRGKPERLAWSEESVRAVLASKFLGRRKPVSSASRDADDN